MNNTLRITAVTVVVLTIAALSVSDSLDAMSWPAEDAVLIKNFGSNDRGYPVMGMVFSGGTDVLAAESGEVIFSRTKNDSASKLPSPLGALTALDHGDGLITIYSRYNDEAVPFSRLEKSRSIASSGVSGWSNQNGFYFIIFDRRDRRWINPAMIITPVQETRNAQILSVELRNAQGQVMQTQNLSQGRYKVFVNAVVPSPTRIALQAPTLSTQGNFLAPQRIVCLVNGAEAGAINFESFSARDGVLMVYRNGLVPVAQVYSAFPAFEAAEVFLTRGQANLEITVQNMAGNSTGFSRRLIVN